MGRVSEPFSREKGKTSTAINRDVEPSSSFHTAAAMPFMRGAAPIRRTFQFLNRGRLVFRDRVKIMTLHFNTTGDSREAHKGMQDFVFWDLHQVQYKNPNVQIVLMKNMTPTPFIRVWLDDASEVVFDVDNQSSKEIVDRLVKVLGKSKEQLDKAARVEEQLDSPANFGREYSKWCICEVDGQVPCPGTIKLPDSLVAKKMHKEGLFKEPAKPYELEK